MRATRARPPPDDDSDTVDTQQNAGFSMARHRSHVSTQRQTRLRRDATQRTEGGSGRQRAGGGGVDGREGDGRSSKGARPGEEPRAEGGRAKRGASGQGGQRRRRQEADGAPISRKGRGGSRQAAAERGRPHGRGRRPSVQEPAQGHLASRHVVEWSTERGQNSEAESLRTRWGSQRDSGAARPRRGETQWAGNIPMYGCNGMDDWRGPCVARQCAPSCRAWIRAWQQNVCSGTPSAAQNACNQTSKALRLQKEGFCPKRHVFLKARVSARLELTQGPINWKQGPRRDRVAGPLRGGSTSS